jgi:RNA polymerase sigma factor (sigma-70 family)
MTRTRSMLARGLVPLHLCRAHRVPADGGLEKEKEMTLTYDHAARAAPLPADEWLPGALSQEDEWEDAHETDTAVEDEAAPAAVLTGSDPETENLVAQYFGEVRQFALLSFAEEQALAHRIVAAKARVRRTLCLAPVALPTLTYVWQQGVPGDAPSPEQVAWHTQLGEALHRLQDLATRLRALARPGPAQRETAHARRTRRQERACLWHQWLATWEALQVLPSVYVTLRQALDTAQRAQPHDAALHAASRAWAHAQRRLDQARAQMLRANLRLVIHIANRYRNSEVPFLDLIQEGNIGLMRALDKFEPQRGLKFVTYAHWWVRQAITRAISEQRRTVRLPSHVVERQQKLRTMSNTLWQVYGRAPSVQELSAALGWTAHEVVELRQAGQAILRLYQPVTEDGGTLADVLEDAEASPPEDRIVEAQFHRRLAECLASLPAREATILRLRYGLETDHPHSLQEIGDLMDLSRERIRQLEKMALEKLRQPHQKALLVDFADVS